ncbi:MAG: hypothetical protein ACXW2Q_09700 [Thermoanaerobaculia bacterium]
MAGNPRENVKDKGFWDGGAGGHGSNKESSGRPSGFPGTRRQRRVGISTDIEFPDEKPIAGSEQEGKVTR